MISGQATVPLTKTASSFPDKVHLDKLFMRKAGLPILKVRFPDGSERPYWNTFYQKINYTLLSPTDLNSIEGLTPSDRTHICESVNKIIHHNGELNDIEWGPYQDHRDAVLSIIESQRHYLGQMDVNAASPLVWAFYDEVLARLSAYGCQIVRLDAFAYLHKAVGQSNFFNKPGTWDHLARINGLAEKHQVQLLPEIHAEYGAHLHDEVAAEGYMIYDFFLPGLLIHAIEKGTNSALLSWAREIIERDFKTVNMLGCHDGIPVLDLKGKEVDGVYREGLLPDQEIEDIIELILARGGRVKNLYGPEGQKISYYQVNATYYSALGESDQKLLLARAIQLFMPGIPQIWYLDIFAGKNDHDAVVKAGAGGHKEINRTTLSLADIDTGLKRNVVRHQLDMIRLRNTSPAFHGDIEFKPTVAHQISILWKHGDDYAELKADLKTHDFTILYSEAGEEKRWTF